MAAASGNMVTALASVGGCPLPSATSTFSDTVTLVARYRCVVLANVTLNTASPCTLVWSWLASNRPLKLLVVPSVVVTTFSTTILDPSEGIQSVGNSAAERHPTMVLFFHLSPIFFGVKSATLAVARQGASTCRLVRKKPSQIGRAACRERE